MEPTIEVPDALRAFHGDKSLRKPASVRRSSAPWDLEFQVKKNIWIDFALPILIVVFLTAVWGLANGDMTIAKRFYSADKGWFLGAESTWTFLYDFGSIPALLLSTAGFFAFVLSFVSRNLLPWRRIGLFLVTFMILGPGLIINIAIKDLWGRPRPADIVDFGGEGQFRHVWEKGPSGQDKSFPSGHAAVGFFLFSPFFILRKSSRKWAAFFLCLGIFCGMLMGFGRMVQGGHFVTDVMWAGAFTYLTGLALYYIFGFDRASIQPVVFSSRSGKARMNGSLRDGCEYSTQD
jgi:lipid A 4'-phosphatase